MKLPIGFALAVGLAAGSAAAQGTFNGGQKSGTFGTPAPAATPYKPYVPSYRAPPAAKPHSPGVAEAPAAPAFKPYEPYKPSSVYASPPNGSATSGAKPCETSVYVNACAKGR